MQQSHPGAQNVLAEDAAALDALRSGDQSLFGDLAARYRRQLHVHCYRMLGSFDDAEDAVQETLLRAWRGRDGFQGRASLKTWLYRIATNVCLNQLEQAPRRVLPQSLVAPVTADFDPSQARSEPIWAPDVPWLQPYPDHLLDDAADPYTQAVSRETIELAYLAAVQHLPPRQRAVFVLRDAVGWSANEVADLLDQSVASINSALQRARATMRQQLPGERDDWARTDRVSPVEQEILEKFMRAWERNDSAAVTTLLREDAQWAMPPAPLWFLGRATIARLLELYPPLTHGEMRMRAVSMNRQPAAATYVRAPGEASFTLNSVAVLRVEGGQIAAITTFGAGLCHGLDLDR